jgi:hypothetical protein
LQSVTKWTEDDGSEFTASGGVTLWGGGASPARTSSLSPPPHPTYTPNLYREKGLTRRKRSKARLMSLSPTQRWRREAEKENSFPAPLHARASAAAKVWDEGAEGGGERGQAVKHGSFCFADADAEMSEVSCASGQRKN